MSKVKVTVEIEQEWLDRVGTLLNETVGATYGIAEGSTVAALIARAVWEAAPKPLKEGDRVRHIHTPGSVGDVLGVYGRLVWVKWADWADPDTFAAADLERI